MTRARRLVLGVVISLAASACGNDDGTPPGNDAGLGGADGSGSSDGTTPGEGGGLGGNCAGEVSGDVAASFKCIVSHPADKEIGVQRFGGNADDVIAQLFFIGAADGALSARSYSAADFPSQGQLSVRLRDGRQYAVQRDVAGSAFTLVLTAVGPVETPAVSTHGTLEGTLVEITSGGIGAGRLNVRVAF